VDLIDSADTGRSNSDNITQSIEDSNLVFSFPAQVGNIDKLWVPASARAYVNGQPFPQLAALPSLTSLKLNEMDLLDTVLGDGDYEIGVTTSYTLIEIGVPPSISSFPLEGSVYVTVDGTPPSGDAHLHPDSDTGPWSEPAYRNDQVTSDRTPSFFGTAEANCLVRVVIDGTPAGSAVVASEDGDAASQGNWQIDTTSSLADGQHTAVFTFEDVAGNQNTSTASFTVDTQGPRVTDVEVTGSANYELFDPTPSDGPTPLVNSLVFTITGGLLYATDAFNKANYQVVGDSNGIIPIKSVAYAVAAPTGTAFVTIDFYEPLPDDRFTLRIADGLVDLAGNALDGESNAIAAGPPQLPSGNGQPGGDFVARFTIDSRPEIGAWGQGRMHLDTNGNNLFDAHNPDASNRDLWLTRGRATDQIFSGDFDGSGFDQIAAYRPTSRGMKWLIDDDRFATQAFHASKGPKGIPVAGDFNGNPADGDEVGVFTGKRWRFDTSNSKDFRLDRTVRSKVQGLPIVGNFDGSGGDDLGVYNPKANKFFLSLDSQGGGIRNGKITTTFRVGSSFPFSGVKEQPVVGDMDGDGFDDIGLYRGLPSRDASSVWSFFVSGGQSLVSRVQQGFIHFMPRPFGNDIFTWFGNRFEKPIVGNFDPPVTRRQANTSLGAEAMSINDVVV